MRRRSSARAENSNNQRRIEEHVRYPVAPVNSQRRREHLRYPEDQIAQRIDPIIVNARRREHFRYPVVPTPQEGGGNARRMAEENVRYSVTPMVAPTRSTRRAEYPATPVTVATPVIPLPDPEGVEDVDLEEREVEAPIDPGSIRCNCEREEHHRPHFRNRMIICLLAVAVNWGTTLRIANRFASNVIRVPSLDFVSRTCKGAYNITRDERMRYSKCVGRQLGKCNTKLDNTVEEEDERVGSLSRQNEEAVGWMEEVATNCSKSYRTLRLSLEDWMTNGGEIPLRLSNGVSSSTTDYDMCSAEDREQFNQTVLGTQNTLALQTEALQMVDAYSEDGTSTVTRLASAVVDLDREISELDKYIVERAKYDVNYIDRKTAYIRSKMYDVVEAMDPGKLPPINVDDILQDIALDAGDLMACVSLDTDARKPDGTACQPNLAQMVEDFAEDAKWKVSFLSDTLYDARDKMNEYRNNALTAYNVAKRFYDGAKHFINIARVVVFWEEIGDWFNVGDRDFYPLDVDFPDVDFAVSNVSGFAKISDMWDSISPRIDEFFVSLSSIPNNIKDKFDEALDGIMMDHSVSLFELIPSLVPSDYNPPEFVGTFKLELNPKKELALYRNMTEMFLTNTRSALGLFSGIGANSYEEEILNTNTPSFNITEIKSKVSSIDLAFEGLSRPDMDYDLWFLQLASLSDGFVLVDYIFRAYVTVRLFVRYWFATALATPNIDLRTNKDIKNPFRMHPARAVVAFATSPTGGFVIFLVSSAWILGIVAALYAPMLYSYRSGCVHTEGNGTFVTNNLYSIAYNHAYQDGSGLLVEGMDAFDAKRADICSSRYASSATLQNGMASNATTYENFHHQMSESMDLARRCIDADKLDSAFEDACCGVATYPDCDMGSYESNVICPMDDRRTIIDIPMPYELPGFSLADPSCSAGSDERDWKIENAVFDCEQLATCSVTCPGPRKHLLDAASERCGCTLEWYLHSKWMASTFAFLLYVFMNVARVSFFSGITRLLWKHLYPERFTVSVTCDSEGALVVPPSKIGSTSHADLISAIQTQSQAGGNVSGLSKELHAKLDRCLKSYYATGATLLLGSLVANGVWVYALAVTSQTLTPAVWRR